MMVDTQIFEALVFLLTIGKYFYIGKVRLMGPGLALLQSVACITLGIYTGLYIFATTYAILFVVDVWWMIRWKKKHINWF